MSGTFYIGSRISEVSLDYAFTEKLKRLVKAFAYAYTKHYSFILSTQDAGHFEVKNESDGESVFSIYKLTDSITQ